MASSGASSSELALRAVLGLAIVALVVVLYFVTVVPAQDARAREQETAITRERMGDIRTALIAYRDSMDTYPSTLDSLVLFVRSDSSFNAEIAMQEERRLALNIDSLVYSPRTGNRFLYDLVQDTTGLEIYWLGDPDQTADSIGTHEPAPAYRNAASWE